MTTKTSYSTTVTLPPNAATIRPTDKSQPLMEPPAAAMARSAKGASAFAAWYERWIVYSYFARIDSPLSKFSAECAQCQEVVRHVQNMLDQDMTFVGDLDAATAVGVDSFDGSAAKVIVKWSNSGYKILDRDGQKAFGFDGGSGYYLMTVIWRDDAWRVSQIATMGK